MSLEASAENGALAGKTVALVVAAGRGHRAGEGLPKQFRGLGSETVLAVTLRALAAHAGVEAIRCVIHPDDEALYRDAISGLSGDKLLAPVPGGAERQDSVRLGLESLADAAPGMVMIHDAARPFLSIDQIDGLLSAFDDKEIAGVLPGLAIVDTVKRANAGGVVRETVDRTGLWRAQTPQCFRFGEILAAHQAVAGQALTDDVAVAEAAGLSVKVIAGDPDNFKLTTPEDFFRAEAFLGGSPDKGQMAMEEFRTGFGFDVHGFEDGEFVTICGVEIPHTKRLKGHSDADVGLHALTDAILGALAEGDIGDHFPPTDEQWRGAPSNIFAEYAAKLVRDKGGRLVHVDLTLICERPKIKPHRAAMRQSTAEILGLPLSAVSVKATTTEKLGFTGREEGIAAQAIATVALPR